MLLIIQAKQSYSHLGFATLTFPHRSSIHYAPLPPRMPRMPSRRSFAP